MPTRSPPSAGETPSLASNARIFFAARSETRTLGVAGLATSVVMQSRFSREPGIAPGPAFSYGRNQPRRSMRGLLGSGHFHAMLGLPVADGGLDGVFGQHRAVNLDRWKCKLADNVRVLDGKRFFHGLALDPLRGERRAGDRGTAAERLEAGFLDDLCLRIDAHLQFHHVAAFRGADEAGADVGVFLRKAADVARIVVVVDDLVAISHGLLLLTAKLTAPAIPAPRRNPKTARSFVRAKRK